MIVRKVGCLIRQRNFMFSLSLSNQLLIYIYIYNMTEYRFSFLCLAPGWYFPLAGQFFIFSANATLHTVSIYPPACLSKHHSTQPAPTGIDFHLSRDYVLHFHVTTSCHISSSEKCMDILICLSIVLCTDLR